jgi:hypothetical protein
MAPNRPQDEWPGLDVNKDELYYNAAKMREVADELERLLAPLTGQGDGTVAGLKAAASLSREALGQWDEVDTLANSVAATGTTGGGATLPHVYQVLVERHKEVIEAIRTQAAIYERYAPDGRSGS